MPFGDILTPTKSSNNDSQEFDDDRKLPAKMHVLTPTKEFDMFDIEKPMVTPQKTDVLALEKHVGEIKAEVFNHLDSPCHCKVYKGLVNGNKCALTYLEDSLKKQVPTKDW